jgi:hypothetical protein
MSYIQYSNTEPLSTSDPEYDSITKLVLASYPKACICMIDKITTPEPIQRYTSFKETSGYKEYTVYHGTSRNNVESIITNGFIPQKAKVCAYGIGIYFAKNFSYSWGYADHQETEIDPMSYIFICKILPGAVCLGSSNAIAPKGFSQGNSQHADTATIFSIPNAEQMLPCYLVRFHKQSEMSIPKDDLPPPSQCMYSKSPTLKMPPLFRKLEAKAKKSKTKKE